MGSQDLYAFWHPLPCICHADYCASNPPIASHFVIFIQILGDSLHHRILSLFSTCSWRLSLVVAFIFVWWVYWRLHLRLLFFLFLQSIEYGWNDPRQLLLWIHGYNFLRILPHAWLHRVSLHFYFCVPHLLCRQSWLGTQGCKTNFTSVCPLRPSQILQLPWETFYFSANNEPR